MSTTFSTLTPEHEEQIHLYLRFMRAKRDIALQQLDNEFEDTRNDRLNEQVYPVSEVEAVLEDLRRLVRASVHAEMGALFGMTSILLKQVLEGAEAGGALGLEINTSVVEDRAVLEAIEKMRADGVMRERVAAAGRLVSLRDEHARIVSERDRAQAEAAAAQEQLRALRLAADGKGGGAAAGAAGAKSDGDDAAALRERVATLERRLAEEEENAQRKLSESRQFQQLKALLSAKSEAVVALRRRLAKYEPDDGDAKDGDEDAYGYGHT